jgi:hypothetical protein
MKKLFFGAAVLALSISSPVLADEGDAGEVHWNPAAESVSAILLRGDTVCDGSQWVYSCYGFMGVTGELLIQYVARQRRGVGVNYTTVRLVAATPDGIVVRDEAGDVVTNLSQTAATENGRARIYNVFSSLLNGMGAAAVQGAFCTLNDCGGGGAGSVSYAISGAEASAVLEGIFQGGNGCATGTCAYNPTHTQNGSGN